MRAGTWRTFVMRILILSEAKTFHAQRWAAGLAERGHTVWLLSRSTARIEGVSIVPLVIPPWGPRYAGRWKSRYEKYIRRTIQRLRPDVVHIHFLEDHPISHDALRDTKLVISTWGSDVLPNMPGDVEPPESRAAKVGLLHLADQVTATTHFLADRTAAYGGLRRDEIIVIPFGVDLSRFAPRSQDGERAEPRVIFLKHFFPKYGPEVFLESVPAILAAHPTARVSMVGEGPMLDSLRGQAKRLGVADPIDWHGPVPHARVPALLSEHNVYVMPSVSESETFGVSAVEAQAAAVPVVCSDLPGVREAVQDGVGGFLVPPRDVDGLAGAIIQLLDDPDLRTRMGQAGRAFVRRRFDWHENVSAMEDAYEQVLAEQGVLIER